MFDRLLALATEKAAELAAHDGAEIAHRHVHAACGHLTDLVRQVHDHLVRSPPAKPAASAKPAQAAKAAAAAAEAPKPAAATPAAPKTDKPAPGAAAPAAAAKEGATK
jgi:hypothetical protein